MKHALYVGWRRWHFAAPILCVLTLATATAGALAGGIRQAVVPHPVVGEPEGLVLLWSVERETGGSNRGIVPGAQLLGWRQRLQGVEGIAALRVWHSSRSASIDFSGEQGPERLRGVLATPNVFDVLRLRPLVGRVFGAADAERSDLVVLGEGFWRRAYGGDPRAVGRSLRLAADAVNPATGIPERSTRPFLVLGVVPDGVSVVPRDTPDVWVMTPWSDVERGPLRPFQYHVVARLKPGTSVEALGDELSAVSVAMGSEAPSDRFLREATGRVELLEAYVLEHERRLASRLSMVVVVVLLIAVVNLTALELARSAERDRTFAIHAALGATPARLRRSLVAEAVALGIIAGVGALVLGQLVEPLIVNALGMAGIEATAVRLTAAGVGGHLLFGAAGAVCATLLASIPVAVPRDLAARLGATQGTMTGSPGRRRWKDAVAMVQAMAVTGLLSLAAMLIYQVWNLQRVPLGFDPDDLVLVDLRTLDGARQGDEALRRFEQQLLTAVRAMPDVRAAGVTSSAPLAGYDATWRLEGRPGYAGLEPAPVSVRHVDAGLFEATGVPILAGRAFTDEDGPSSPAVAIVSESFGRWWTGDARALGYRLRLSLGDGTEVVGVVGDVSHGAPGEPPRPTVYVHRPQRPTPQATLVLRTSMGPEQVRRHLVAALRDIGSSTPVETVVTMESLVARTVGPQSMYAAVTAALGVLTLLLAAAGVYGMASESVATRSREAAVRIALGGPPAAVVRLLVARGVAYVAAGTAIGLVVALVTIDRWLPTPDQSSPWSHDIAAGTAAALVVTAVCAIGMYVPSRRILRLQPVEFLRDE